jgi:hypothetical protein
MGCKLTIATFNAPDTANTGSVIPLTISCTATNINDGSSVNGVVVQIPAGWSVIYAKVSSFGNSDVTEDAGIAGLYTAEANQVIWAGVVSSSFGIVSGSEGSNVSFTIKVLTGNFSGSYGQTQNYNLKVAVGAKRGGVWITDDPGNVFDFAAVTGEKYKKSITVTKVEDTTAPNPITNIVASTVYTEQTTAVQVAWDKYDEAAQGDVVAYRVYRSTNDFSDVSSMVPIAEVSAGHYSHLDYNIMAGNGYYYGVTAIDELGHENPVVSAVHIFVHFPGSIAGALYNTDGVTPIIGKYIEVTAYTGSCASPVQAEQTNKLDLSTGRYTITGLLPGTYFLKISTSENYISEWWDSPLSVRDCAEAQSIVVAEGQTVTDKNFQLDPGATISGTVDQTDGVTPLTGENIYVYAYIGSPCGSRTEVGFPGSYAWINSAGIYTITGLPAGAYYLAVDSSSGISEWWASPRSVRDCAGAQSIVVTEGQTVTGKNFQLDTGTLFETDGVSGIWKWDGSAWAQLTSANPENMVTTGSTLYVDFGASYGLYKWDGAAWNQLTPANPESMVASRSALYVDFGATYGLYKWDGAAWNQLTSGNPEDIIYPEWNVDLSSYKILYADFGATYGLWKWDGTAWSQLTPANPENMVTSGSTLYADFGAAYGLWKWDGAEWSQLTPANPENMVTSGSTLYADFGAVYGLWKWDGAEWSQLTPANPDNMVTSGSTLYADFGALGLYKWNGSAWSQLTSANPENMVTTGSTLYVDFGALGIYEWNGSSWSQLTESNPVLMVVLK